MSVGNKHLVAFGAEGAHSGQDLFETFALFLVFVSAVEIVITNEPQLPQLGPQMVEDDFEPSVARLLLLVDFRVVKDVSCLDVGPLLKQTSESNNVGHSRGV